MDKVEEQLNIRVSAELLKKIQAVIEKDGRDMSLSAFGRLAVEAFILQVDDKGSLALFAEIMDKYLHRAH